ncbi:hypothetical protein AQUCO_00300828v1 [Aquilegia coerulea]|uniref:C3H1-type domain-containing protein n=2 Tax=Aquilegia coerulea TaxID=218851 RepID=A0A2G5F0M8_AQUCA|nr:hypothetical protein AQUCO_00300828v1 [Aquilegia coerulea]
MDLYGRNPTMEGSQLDPPTVGWTSSSQTPESGLVDSMWQLGLGGRDSYPERPGEPNCVYYMRTGTCGYGARCRFNHPHDRTAAAGAMRQAEEYPEREGQPACQYFMKTGNCKFGASCKYHHPKYEGGIMSSVLLNYYGYPLRPGEKECSYYVKTGQCKFGLTCKFHHPQPASSSVAAPAPTYYPPVQSTSVASPQQYGVTTSWQAARPTMLPGSYVQGAYGPVLLSPGMVPVQAWSPYAVHAPLSPVASPGTQPTAGAGQLYGVTQLSPSATAYTGPYQPLPSSAVPSSSTQRENMFPERPGQPECQYYLKMGDCKFGSTCRYHHPAERISPTTNCMLSIMGLPLRPGAPTCTFFLQHGICKFGPMCRFDHPMGTLNYSPSASSLAEMPVAPYPVGSSLVALAPSSSTSELRPEVIAGSMHNSFSTRMTSAENTSSGLIGPVFARSGTVPHPSVQFPVQGLAPSGDSSSTDHVSEVRSSS